MMLDTRVVLQLCVPGRCREAKEWFRQLLRGPARPELLASVLVDFELRRGLARLGATTSMHHYTEFAKAVRFIPVSLEATRRAAELTRDAKSLEDLSEADALIAAQALLEDAILVTPDRALHRVPGLDARDWSTIDPLDPRAGTPTR
jgi:predicted nucleic acid-binding protein